MKIYISGPITGHDYQERKQAFQTVADQIAEAGHEPVNPMALDHSQHDKKWESYMKVCITALMDCDRIYIMPEPMSRGVRVEWYLAREMGIEEISITADFETLKP